MIAYKVAKRQKNGKLISVFARGKFKTTYQVGEIVEVEGTLGLFCFVNQEGAKYFAESSPGSTCVLIVKGLDEPIYPRYIAPAASRKELIDFYRYKDPGISPFFLVAPIPGTVCFHKIKVLEVLK